MSEDQNINEENFPEKNQENLPPIAPFQSNEKVAGSEITKTSTLKAQQMEVHNHPHLHFKEKWKEYIFQFLMLFLAVFLGSYAESRREHGIEKSKEKEYMESMVVDLGNDMNLAGMGLSNIYEQVKKIDSLQTLFSPDLQNGSNEIKDCYRLSYYIRMYYPISFNENTMSQLISSGNMRLIKSKEVSDSIMQYYTLIKSYNEQKQLYYSLINKCIETLYNVFDIADLRTKINSSGDLDTTSVEEYKFLTHDPLEFKKLNARMEVAKSAAWLFCVNLLDLKNKAENLHLFLENQYGFNAKDKKEVSKAIPDSASKDSTSK